MRSSSRLAKFVKFVKVFRKKRKAQFFILAAFTMVTMFYFISRWIEPFSIIDTSQVPLMDEIFIFNNIKEKTIDVIKNSKTCTDLNYNLQEYRDFVINYALSKGYKLDFNYLLTPCNPDFLIPVDAVLLNITLQSPRTTLASLFSSSWPS